MTSVVVLGAKRIIGQTLLSRLVGHPWLTVTALGDLGLPQAERPFAEACEWALADPMPHELASIPHRTGDPASLAQLTGPDTLVLSVLPDGESGPTDRACAAMGARVVTHGEDLRLAEDVPLVIPELTIEPPDSPLVATPNCTTVMLALALAALRPLAEIDAVTMTCLQAISGADLPGPPSLLMIDNVYPHLRGEELALEHEIARLFDKPPAISVQAARVPVRVGHTLMVSMRLSGSVMAEDLVAAWRGYCVPPELRHLPSVVAQPIRVVDMPDRPSVRPDSDAADGMAITIGALRACPVLDWRFVLVGNNMIRGSAGMSLLTAEWLTQSGEGPR